MNEHTARQIAGLVRIGYTIEIEPYIQSAAGTVVYRITIDGPEMHIVGTGDSIDMALASTIGNAQHYIETATR